MIVNVLPKLLNCLLCYSVYYLIFNSNLSAQTRNLFLISSDKNINTYHNRSNLGLTSDTNNFRFTFSDDFHSTIISGTTPIYREENLLNLQSVYKYSTLLSPLFEVRSFVVKDNYLTTNRTEYNSILSGLQFKPTNYLQTSTLFGFRQDVQQEIKDKGFGFTFITQLDSAIELPIFSNSIFQMEKYIVGDRTLSSKNGIIGMSSNFANNGYDSIQVRYFEHQSDFYISADSNILNLFKIKNNIRSRKEDVVSVLNILNYPLTSNLIVNLNTSVDSRNIGNSYKYFNFKQSNLFPTNVKELRLGGAIQLLYNFDDGSFSTGIGYTERNEDHFLNKIDSVPENIFSQKEKQELQLNNSTQRTNIWGRYSQVISNTDLINFQFSSGILKYNTPSTENVEDRDELAINISLEEQHVFHKNLIMRTTSDVLLTHNVYLLKERSANNLWNRVIRFGVNFVFTPTPYFRSTNSFDVLANYSVYDFESTRSDVKSYSYRQFRLIDSTKWKFNSNFEGILHVQFREYIRGQFAWNSFSERPEEFVDELFFSPTIKYSLDEISFSSGLKSFQQIRYRYVAEKRIYYDNFISAGPTIQISWKKNNFELLCTGWRDYRFLSGERISIINDFQLSAKYLW